MYEATSNSTEIPRARKHISISGLLRPPRRNTHFNIHFLYRASYFFQRRAFLCNSLSGISVRMKRVCTERISVAVRITTCFLLPYCAGTDPLSASSPSSLLIPFPLLKKKIHCSALFHFPIPTLRQLLLIWNF